MAYYNRKEQLDMTLASIRNSQITNYEVVIVDDASDEPLVCDEARVIRVEKKDKWWTNPCIPFNMAFKEAKGDLVIIQNPECYHKGDILAYVQKNIKYGQYLSFACYAINKEETVMFKRGVFPVLEDRTYRGPEENGWFNHSVYRPIGYHFCSAITKHTLDIVGGFDERYAMGVSFDDDDFIRKIGRNMEVWLIDDPYAIHQWHPPYAYQHKDMMKLHRRNQRIYNGE